MLLPPLVNSLATLMVGTRLPGVLVQLRVNWKRVSFTRWALRMDVSVIIRFWAFPLLL